MQQRRQATATGKVRILPVVLGREVCGNEMNPDPNPKRKKFFLNLAIRLKDQNEAKVYLYTHKIGYFLYKMNY